MTKGSNTLTPMRRRAVDRLLIDYLELPEREQPAWLARTRQRLPRLGRWLVQLVDDSHTVTLLDESVRRLAGQSVDRMEINAARLTEGDRLGPWQVIEEIGEGGMGRVYRGQRADGAFEMDVAIKQIGQRRRGLAELLQRECRLLAKLDHPSVTRLIDAGLDDRAGPFLVMEWVEGTDLGDWLKHEKPDLDTRLRLFEQITEAVAHAHQRLIVHGDIKPDNIRVRGNGSVKLMDFGVARLLDSAEADQAGLRALTPAFAAPEQHAGKDITPASDIWTLGALLHWLITGKVFSQRVDDPDNTLVSTSGRRRQELTAIVARACARLPESRYANSKALLDDLRNFAEHRPLQAMPNSRRYRLNRFMRRNPTLMGGAAAAALMLVIGLISTSLMYLQADSARKVAVLERERAELHAGELEQVASFQAEQLGELDVAAMALALRSRLMETPDSPGSDALESINWTDLQLELIDSYLLEGSLGAIETHFRDQPLVRARLLQSLATTRRTLGLLDGADSVQEQVMALVMEHTGLDHPLRATALHQQGLMATALGQQEHAHDRLKKAWELRRETLGEDHPDTLVSKREFGLVVQDMGQLDEAEEMLRRVLERRLTVLGECHPRTLDSFLDLGVIQFRKRQLAQAEEHLRTALHGRITELGAGHPSTLGAKVNLAVLLRHRGELEEAEALNRTVIDARRTLLGDSHPDTIMAINNQAVLLHTQGRLAEAETHLLKALAGYRAVLGEDHPNTANTLNNLGVIRAGQNDIESAEIYLRQALSIRLRVLGEAHPATLQTWSTLSSVLRESGQADQALVMSEQALEGRRALLGPKNVQTLLSQTQHGANLRAVGQLEEAEQIGAAAIRLAREVLPPDHWRLGTHLGEYGRTLAAAQRFDEAEDLLQEAFAIQAGSLGEDHFTTRRTAEYLARLYAEWNNFEPNEDRDRKHREWTKLAQVSKETQER